MTFNHPHGIARLIAPGAVFGLSLLLALLIVFLPTRVVETGRSALADVLAPGQKLLWSGRRWAKETGVVVTSHFRSAGRLADVEKRLERVEDENRRLRDQLAAARAAVAMASSVTDEENGEPSCDRESLLRAHCIPARVLGSQAKSYLAEIDLLDVGNTSGVGRESLVVESITGAALLDRGADARLASGGLVLAGGRVLGKVGRVGRHTCTLRTIASAGYRDLVVLTGPDGRQPGPQGILEGTGGPLARLRFVEIAEPVAEGDLVWSISGKGVLPAPLLCGRVVHAERPVGEPHWKIDVRPAVTSPRVEHVMILQTELNAVGSSGQ